MFVGEIGGYMRDFRTCFARRATFEGLIEATSALHFHFHPFSGAGFRPIVRNIPLMVGTTMSRLSSVVLHFLICHRNFPYRSSRTLR